jgi:DNA-binding NarL/FixJ family response regulator
VKSIRVLLADDHALVRAGIRALIDAMDGVEVVAEAGDGEEALQLIREHQPDVILLDITMPQRSGFDVLDQTRRDFPDVKVVILTVHDAGEYAIRALRAGANGFLTKGAASAELREAIEMVVRGDTYISPAISQKTLLEYGKGAASGAGLSAELTPRQQEILKLIAEGFSTKKIARSLNISVKTVESHRAQLMERLNIHDVAGLVRYAIRIGVIELNN